MLESLAQFNKVNELQAKKIAVQKQTLESRPNQACQKEVSSIVDRQWRTIASVSTIDTDNDGSSNIFARNLDLNRELKARKFEPTLVCDV